MAVRGGCFTDRRHARRKVSRTLASPNERAEAGLMTIPSQRRPVCMIVHAYYEEDSRVRREAESLVARGRPVDVFALRRPRDEPTGVVDGVRVHRLDVQRHQGAGLGVYLREYLAFAARAALALARAHRRRRYGLVQVHTLP